MNRYTLMREVINNFLEPLAPLLPLLVLLANLRMLRQQKEFPYLLTVYLTLFCIEGTAAVYAFTDTPNIWLYDLDGLFAFITLSFYFGQLLKKESHQKIVYFILPVFCIFYLGYTYILGNHSIFNSTGYAALSVFISFYCLLYFMECLQFVEDRKLIDNYSFWVVTGFFMFYLGSFFIFISYQAMTSNGIQTGMLWGLHNIIYFVSCCIAATGLWKHFQKKFTL